MKAPHLGCRSKQEGFTLTELVVCIAIVAIASLITFGVIMRVKDGAKDTTVLSNLRQIGVSHILYAQDYDDGLPSIVPVSGGVPSSYNQGDRIEDIPMTTFKGDAKGWKGLLIPYGPESGMFYSPADPYARSNHALFGTSGPYDSADSSVTYCMGAMIPSSVHQGFVFWRLSRAEEWNRDGIRPFLVTNIFEPTGQMKSITVHRLGRRVPAWYLEGNSKMIDVKQANPAYN
ncbi:MAG: type II secretion system protein [Armatimonadota bacterium]